MPALARATAIALVAVLALVGCSSDDPVVIRDGTDGTAPEDSDADDEAAPEPDADGTAPDDSDADDTALDDSAAPEPDDTAEPRNPGDYGAYGIYERVRFPAGSTGTTISDGTVTGTVNGYLLEAAAGQTMTLSITSVEDNGVFEVYGPDDTLVAAQGTEATIDLPADGDYLVVVSSNRGNASYDLVVEIS